MTPAAPLARALELLREYVEEAGLVRLGQYLASPELYYVDPAPIGSERSASVAAVDRWAQGDTAELRLALCLMADVPLPRTELPGTQAELCEALIRNDLLVEHGGALRMGSLQLTSFYGLPLLVDHRLGFSRALHDVYVGSDTAALAYYVDVEGIAEDDPVLDLGTGTGALAVYLARFSRRVTATDIMPGPLWLASVNRTLAGAEDRIEIRREEFIDTIARGRRHKVVTFNPPFVLYPEGFEGPTFARGIGRDGLDYCRMLVELFDEVVAPDGAAYIVADLLGGAGGPFFVSDLHRYAAALDLAVDVFVEGRNDLRLASRHFDIVARTAIAGAGAGGASEDAARESLRRTVLHELGATHTWFAVTVVRRSRGNGPRVTVFDRRRE